MQQQKIKVFPIFQMCTVREAIPKMNETAFPHSLLAEIECLKEKQE